MTDVAPEPSHRFGRHFSMAELWLTLTAWAWGPGLWIMAWTTRQAPQFDWLSRPTVAVLIVGSLGAPVALIVLAVRLYRHFAKPPLLRLAVQALIVVLAQYAPEPPLRPEQEWHADLARLQALADATLHTKGDAPIVDGPWSAVPVGSDAVLTLRGFDQYRLVYSPKHSDDFARRSGEAINRIYEKDLGTNWSLWTETRAW